MEQDLIYGCVKVRKHTCEGVMKSSKSVNCKAPLNLETIVFECNYK